jgi:hypothetical protein
MDSPWQKIQRWWQADQTSLAVRQPWPIHGHWNCEERLLPSPPAITAVANVTYVEDAPPVTLDPLLTVTETDGDTIEAAEIQLLNYNPAQDQLLIPNIPNLSIIFDQNTGTLVLLGTGTPGQYQTYLSQIQYVNTSPAPSPMMRTAQITLVDSQNEISAPTLININIQQVADTPSVTNATTLEDTLSSGGLVITSNPLDGPEVTHFQITNITQGTLFLNDGVTAVTNGSFITVAQGSAGLRFQPALNFNGTGTFDVQASLANNISGLGGQSVTASILVTPVNDPPTITTPGLQFTNEAIAVTFSSMGGNPIAINDVDAGSALLTLQFTATGPTSEFTLASTTGINFLNGTNGGTTPLQIQGTLANLQAALNGFMVRPLDNGQVTLNWTITDDQLATATASVSIQVLNVAPTVILTGPTTGNEGTAITITANVTDPAGSYDPLTIDWAVTKDGNAFATGSGINATFIPDDNGLYEVLFAADDGDGGVTVVSQIVTVNNVNPTLTLTGPSTGVEGTSLTITGSATDPANPPTTSGINDPLTFSWSVTKNGNPYTTGTGPNATFLPDDNGTYVVIMTVIDGDGGSDTKTQTIIVDNVAPTLTLTGPTTGIEGTSLTITGSATDPANPPTTSGVNDPLTFSWSVTKNGNPYTTGTGPNATFLPDDNGTYIVTMTVIDGDGGSDTKTQTITVDNVAPTLTLTGPTTGIEGTSLTITGSATDPANPPTTSGVNDPLTFSWSVTKNGNPYTTGTGPNATFLPDDNGTYVVIMTVIDGDGGSDTKTQTITVDNVAPTLTLTGPTTGVEGTSLTITGSATDPANPPTTSGINDPLTFSWSVTKNGNPYTTGTGPNATFLPDDNGTYIVTMTVIDGDGGSDTKTQTITVDNVAPTLTLTGPTTGVEGTSLTITGSATDPANPPTTSGVNDPLTFSWSVTKNGNPYTTGTGPNATFLPDDNGTYVVTMTVIDGDGGSDTKTQTIIVDNVAPTLTLTGPTTGIEGATFTVTATTSDPANPPVTSTENDPLTLTWTVTKNGNPYATGIGDTVTFQADDNGTYVVTMTVADDDNGVTVKQHMIMVANVAPTPTFSGPTSGFEGTPITWNGSATDPANPPTTSSVNDPLIFHWVVTKNGVGYASGFGSTITFTPDNDANYHIFFTASDDDGGATTIDQAIQVANVLPTPIITATDINGQFYSYVNTTVLDPGNDTILVQIIWGDVLPNDNLLDLFLPGEMPDPRVFAEISHRYLVAPNPQDPLAPVTITFLTFDGTDVVVTQITVQVTEQGIPLGGIYITPEPTQIKLPPPLSTSVTQLLVSNPVQLTRVTDEIVARGELIDDTEQKFVLKIISANGQASADILLQDNVLQDLPGLFKKLPDGHYRIYLVQNDTRRLVIDVFVRQGLAVDPSQANEDTGERPNQRPPAIPNTPPTSSFPQPDAQEPISEVTAELPELSAESRRIASLFLPTTTDPTAEDRSTTSAESSSSSTSSLVLASSATALGLISSGTLHRYRKRKALPRKDLQPIQKVSHTIDNRWTKLARRLRTLRPE